MRRIVILFVVAFASVFGAACGGGAGQQDLEILEARLEARVAELEEDVENLEAAVENLKVVAGTQWAEEQKQEETQP